MAKHKDENPLQFFKDRFIQLHRENMGEIPKVILNTMDILFEKNEYKPLLIRNGAKQYNGGWHFVFTLNPGCSYEKVLSNKDYFKSVVEGMVEIERKGKFLHIDVSDFQFAKEYAFDEWITPKIANKYKNMWLPIPIGIKAGGKLLFVDMIDFSHMMLAGVNTSGKSAWLRQVMMFLALYRPDIMLVYIDFMRLDAKPMKNIAIVGGNLDEAHFLLEQLCKEVQRRLTILEDADCFKASEYTGIENIPPILVAIDELAELEDKESQHMLNHLARTSRKCGVHIIPSLQRPSHTTYKNFTDSRSQFPARLCFHMAEGIDSEIVLGKGNYKASELPADRQGRAIWHWNKEIEIQGLFLSNSKTKELLSGINKKVVNPFGQQKQNFWYLPR